MTKDTLWAAARKVFFPKAFAGLKEAALERGFPVGAEPRANPKALRKRGLASVGRRDSVKA